MTSHPNRYHGYRFPPAIISYAVWLYHRFGLSFRDVEDLLAERGITVTYEAIRHWCLTFGLDYARRLRRRRGRLGDTWYLDEVFVKIQGRQQYLWRAVDKDGDVIDILVQSRAQSRGGRALLSQVVERTRSRTSPPDHGQAPQLRRGAPRRDAVRGAQHAAVREQSCGTLASTDPSTGTPDASLQVGRPSATLCVGARRRAESLPGGSAPAAGCSPPAAANPGVRRVGCGDVRRHCQVEALAGRVGG